MELQPYKGIGDIILGKEIDLVRKKFDSDFISKKSERTETTFDYFNNASIQIEYDKNDRIIFIGVTKQIISFMRIITYSVLIEEWFSHSLRQKIKIFPMNQTP